MFSFSSFFLLLDHFFMLWILLHLLLPLIFIIVFPFHLISSVFLSLF